MTGRELLNELEAQETSLVFDRFDEDTAWALGVTLRASALSAEAPVAISIRRNGQRLFHAALPGASADNDGWLDRKCAVVDRYGRSSLRVGEQFRVAGRSFDRTPGSTCRSTPRMGARSRSSCAGPAASAPSRSPASRSSRTIGSWSRPSRPSWRPATRLSEGCPLVSRADRSDHLGCGWQ